MSMPKSKMQITEIELRGRVFSSLKNATEQGYSFDGWADEDIALDLLAYAADVEDATLQDLIPHVRAWRETTSKDKHG